MRERGFSVQQLASQSGASSESGMRILEKVSAAETQAIAIVRKFKEIQYMTPEKLFQFMAEQKLGPVDMAVLVGYLAGYMASETFDSKFEKACEFSSGFDGKAEVTGTSLVALVATIDRFGIEELPERRPDTIAVMIANEMLELAQVMDPDANRMTLFLETETGFGVAFPFSIAELMNRALELGIQPRVETVQDLTSLMKEVSEIEELISYVDGELNAEEVIARAKNDGFEVPEQPTLRELLLLNKAIIMRQEATGSTGAAESPVEVQTTVTESKTSAPAEPASEKKTEAGEPAPETKPAETATKKSGSRTRKKASGS